VLSFTVSANWPHCVFSYVGEDRTQTSNSSIRFQLDPRSG
jgi:hypothetical protein